jgi:hypothetical protein
VSRAVRLGPYARRRDRNDARRAVSRTRLFFAVTRPPTDFELLRAIYERHRGDFRAYVDVDDPVNRGTKVMVPIDIPKIAGELRVDPDSVFGRLYFHLDPTYGEEPDDGPRKAFFSPLVGDDLNCVNFPLLEAVLAGLWQQRDRDFRTAWLAVVSIIVAVGSLAATIVVAATA